MPKRKSSELFELISSLSKNEAGYFKKFSARHAVSGKPDYISLFDALAGQKTNDEDRLLARHKFKNYSRLKHYLYNSILQSLYSYHSVSNSNTQLRKYLNDIELLYGKALYGQCKKLLKKAKSIAEKYEKFNAVIDLISWEIKILQSNIELDVLQKNASRFLNDSREAFEKMQNITAYVILYSQFYSLIRKRGQANNYDTKKIYDKIISNRLLKNERYTLSEHARILYYHIHSVYAFACNQPKKENQYSKLLIEYIEKKSALFEEEKERYLIALNNYINSSIQINKFQNAVQHISKMKSLHLSYKKQPDIQNLLHRIFARTFILELSLLNKTGNPSKAVEIISQNEIPLKKLKSKLNLANIAELYYRIAYSYFLAGAFRKSLTWLNKIITDKHLTQIRQFYTYASLLNIAVHIELENYDYALSLIKNISGNYKKLNRFEIAILECFENILHGVYQPKETIKNIYALHLEKLKSFENNPFENMVLYYFDIISWMVCKTENCQFADIMRKKAMIRY